MIRRRISKESEAGWKKVALKIYNAHHTDTKEAIKENMVDLLANEPIKYERNKVELSRLSKYVIISDDGTWTLVDEGLKEMKKFHNQYGPKLPSGKTSSYNFILMELYSSTLKTNKILECGIGVTAFLNYTFCTLKTDKLITHPEKLYDFTTQWIREHGDTINSMKKEGYGSDHIHRTLSVHFARLLKEIIEKEEECKTQDTK